MSGERVTRQPAPRVGRMGRTAPAARAALAAPAARTAPVPRMAPKRRPARGFSFVETLVALLVVVLASGMVATGIPAALDAYTSVVDTSNAQTLLSTGAALLRGRLDDALEVSTVEVEVTSGEAAVSALCLVDGDTGFTTYLVCDSTQGILVADMVADGSGSTTPSSDDWQPLAEAVASQTKGVELVLGYDGLAYDADTNLFTLSGLKVWRSSGSSDSPLVSMETYTIRRVAQ